MTASQPALANPNSQKPAAYQPLIPVIAAMAAGIVFDWAAGLSLGRYLAVAGVSLLFWCVTRRHPAIRLGLTLLLVATTAAGWHHCRWSLFEANDIGRYAGDQPRPCCVEGTIVRGPRVLPAPEWGPLDVIPRGERTRLDLAVEAIRDGTRWLDVSGTAALYVDGALEAIGPGDRVRVYGGLIRPDLPQNPGQFDRRAHYRTQRVLCMIRAGDPRCVEVVATDSRFHSRRLLDGARRGGAALLDEYLGESHSGLASAILLGARDRVDESQRLAFQETGTVHLLAISGLHVGIVYGGVLLLARAFLLRPTKAVLLAAACCVAYAVLTDARPPAIRASLLFVIMSLAFVSGRRSIAPNALAAAGIFVLVLNPTDLFATGVQLSFLAVAGLIWAGRRWAGWDRPEDALEKLVVETAGWFDYSIWWTRRKLWQLFALSATVWFLTTPLVLAEFHVVSPIGLLFNIFLSIPLAVALIGGFGVLIFGAWCPLAAIPFAWTCDAALGLIHGVVTWGESAPAGHFWLPGPPIWWLCGFYGAIALMLVFPRYRPAPRLAFGLVLAWCGLGCLVTGAARRSSELTCSVLSIGHGAAIVVELPTGETVLYDAGQLSSASSGADTIANFLWSHGIMHLDAVVLSHADADHYNAVPGLLERFSIQTACVGPTMFQNASGAVGFLRRALEAHRVEVKTVRRGDTWRLGECIFTVFHPGKKVALDDDNANCLVVGIEYEGRRILLTGDIASSGIAEVVAQSPWDCDVFLVPHHGSKSGHSPALTAWAKPEIAVASNGSRDIHPEVAAHYTAIGSRLLSTAKEGTVRLRLYRDSVDVDCHGGKTAVRGQVKRGRFARPADSGIYRKIRRLGDL